MMILGKMLINFTEECFSRFFNSLGGICYINLSISVFIRLDYKKITEQQQGSLITGEFEVFRAGFELKKT